MLGDTNRSAVRFSTETLWGEVPAAPTMQALRFTGETLEYAKETTVSSEIRSDANVPNIAQTGVAVQGGLNYELSCTTFDVLLAAVARGAWTAISLAALTLTVAAGAKTITRAAGSFVTDGIVVGVWVKFGNFVNAGNNGIFRVTAVTATVLTVEDPTAALVNEAGPGTGTVKSRWMRNGILTPSFLIEKAFLDIAQFIYFQGMRFSDATLNVAAKAIVTGTFTAMGKVGTPGGATIAGAITPQTTTDVLTASANVGSIQKNGVTATEAVKSITMGVKNNLRQQPVVGSKFTAGLGYGRTEITGNVEIYVSDFVLFNNMVNHDTVELTFRLTDAAGNVIIVTLPSIKFLKGMPNATAINTDVFLTLAYQAILDPVTSCQIQIDTIL